jgi:hypothetical protein
MKNDVAPLCVCGKPRKLSKKYVQSTGSFYYVTCGDYGCRRKNNTRPKVVGKKVSFVSFGYKSNPHHMCERPGCTNEVGQSRLWITQKRFCSTECRLFMQAQENHKNIERYQAKNEYRREYLSQVYADVKAGATHGDIRRKYGIGSQYVEDLINSALTNRRREINDQLNSNKKGKGVG